MMLAEVSVISIVLFIAVIVFAIMAVSFKDQLSAAISLAALSAALAIIFYRLNSPYAAVIELSVCAGLITALFVAAISLTRRR
jgi:NADH-quinone oxidoreductase subunit J